VYRSTVRMRPIRKMISVLVGGFLILALVALGSSAGATSSAVDAKARALLPASIRSAGVITVASSLGYAPYDFLAANGTTPEGIDQDLIRDIAPILGVHFKVTNVNYPNIVPALQAKHYELGWSAIGEDPQEENVLEFVTYLFGDESGGIVPATNSHIKTADQDSLCGESVGQVDGEPTATLTAISAQCTKDGKPPLVIKYFQQDAQVALALESGQVDIRLDDYGNGSYVAAHSNDKLKFVQNIFTKKVTGYSGVALLPGQNNFAQAISDALEDLIKDGKYAAILKKWSAPDDAIQKTTLVLPK
jgi:polar amino acid transport system substrate-binding protein